MELLLFLSEVTPLKFPPPLSRLRSAAPQLALPQVHVVLTEAHYLPPPISVNGSCGSGYPQLAKEKRGDNRVCLSHIFRREAISLEPKLLSCTARCAAQQRPTCRAQHKAPENFILARFHPHTRKGEGAEVARLFTPIASDVCGRLSLGYPALLNKL